MKTYQKLCTEFYDLELHRDGQVSAIFYQQQALEACGPILEPMCGTGRFLIPMLQAGLDVEGFDASLYMLDALREKCVRLNLSSPPVWQQYVQDFSLSKQYKLIFVPYGSWGLITNLEDSKKSLAIMYNHLDTGGKFILEIETVSSVPEPCGIWRRGVHSRLDGSKIAVNTLASFDIRTQIFKSLCRYELIIDSVITEVENEDFQMYLYRFDERDALLQEVGFKIINKYQDYTLTPATNKETPIIIYECSR